MERTIKVTGKNYEQIKTLADATGMGVKAVAERLLDEGLAATAKTGKVVADNPAALAKLQKSVVGIEKGQEEILDRLDELEDEEGEEEEGENAPKKFEVKPPSVKREERDGFRYYCAECGVMLVGEPEEDRPDTCRDCGAKLDWKRMETVQEDKGGGTGAGTAVLVGFLALLAVSALSGARSTT